MTGKRSVEDEKRVLSMMTALTVHATIPHPHPGDVNGDKTLDIMDCIALNKFLVGAGDLTDAQRKTAGMNSDGDITADDSLALLKAMLGNQS